MRILFVSVTKFFLQSWVSFAIEENFSNVYINLFDPSISSEIEN